MTKKKPFEEWMAEVQKNFRYLTHGILDLRDMPDLPFRDMYDMGFSPSSCAKECMEMYAEDDETFAFAFDISLD